MGSDENDKVYTFRQALEQLIALSSAEGITYVQDAQYVRPTRVPYLIGDTSKFREETGWRPEISFEQILRDTLAYWRERV